jgi:hypothetical protein
MGLVTTNGSEDGDVFVPSDSKRTHRVASFKVSRYGLTSQTFSVNTLLVSQLSEHLGGSYESITALSDANVQHQFLDVELSHDISLLGGFGRRSTSGSLICETRSK